MATCSAGWDYILIENFDKKNHFRKGIHAEYQIIGIIKISLLTTGHPKRKEVVPTAQPAEIHKSTTVLACNSIFIKSPNTGMLIITAITAHTRALPRHCICLNAIN